MNTTSGRKSPLRHVVLVLIILAGGYFMWQSMQSSIEETPKEAKETKETVSKKPKLEAAGKTGITKLDEKWNIYTNRELGFAIKIPADDAVKIAAKPTVKGNVVDFRPDLEFGWKISIEKAENRAAMEKFMKSKWQEGCRLGRLNGTPTPGVFDVNPVENGPDTGCFLNYVTYMQYYEPAQKIAHWDVGQEQQFMPKDESIRSDYDMVMTNSFTFLD